MILLKFDKTLDGDSVISGHEKWITIDSFQWGVGRAITQSGGGQDRRTSNPSFSEVTLAKSMDVASTELWRQAVCGESMGIATIHFVETSGSDSKVQKYYEVKLHDAIVSSFSSSSGGDRPHESISINFTKVEHAYDVFEKGGTVKTGEVKNWDLMANATF